MRVLADDIEGDAVAFRSHADGDALRHLVVGHGLTVGRIGCHNLSGGIPGGIGHHNLLVLHRHVHRFQSVDDVGDLLADGAFRNPGAG